jgi:hypothetical protein
LFFAIEILKFLVPLLDTSRHTLSQLSNLILRQSEDAANADPMNNAMPHIQASTNCKSLFMVIRRKNKNYINNDFYNKFITKVKCFFENVNIKYVDYISEILQLFFHIFSQTIYKV